MIETLSLQNANNKPRNINSVKTAQVVDYATLRANTFFHQLNTHLKAKGEETIDVSDVAGFQEAIAEIYTSKSLDSGLRSVKAVWDGSTAALGDGIEYTDYARDGQILHYPGRSFSLSGVEVRRNQGVSYIPFGATSSRFSGFSTSTPSAGDQNPTGKKHTVDMLFRKASIAITKVLGARSLVDIYLKFEQLLEEKKELHLDELLAEYATTAANGADQLAIPSVSSGVITEAATRMARDLNGYGICTFYTTQIGWSKWRSEKDDEGRFLTDSGRLIIANTGATPRVGLVAYFDGSPVFINNGIKDAGSGAEGYVVTAGTNAISAQTGGTATALIAGLPTQASIGRGDNRNDKIKIFGAENGDRDSFFSDNDEIGAAFLAGAAMVNDDAWKVFAIA